jgi:hypothetical protein
LHKLGKNLDWQLLVKQAMSRDFIDSRLKAPWLKPVTNPVCFTESEIAQLMEASGGHPHQKLMPLCYKTYVGYQEEIP